MHMYLVELSRCWPPRGPRAQGAHRRTQAACRSGLAAQHPAVTSNTEAAAASASRTAAARPGIT